MKENTGFKLILKKALSAILLFLLPAFFLSCTRTLPKSDSPLQLEGYNYEKSLLLYYAKEFKIDQYSSGAYLVTVAGSDRYLLLPKEAAIPKNLPAQVAVISLPVSNVYLCASSAMALWNRLDSLDSIKFSAVQKKDWYVESALQAMEDGRIIYAGKYNAPDFELLLKENCPLAIESTMIYHTPQIKEKLESLGIPVFVDKSSYEENPLGRMEWIRLYALMCGKLEQAENFFDEQVSKIQSTVTSQKSAPKSVAFFYINATGMVVVRGSEDYIVKMIEMAGGDYTFKNTRKTSSPSVSVSMEQFYAQCADADILIYNSSIDNTLHSKADLLSKSPLFADFKAVQNGEIWTTGKYLYQATDRIGDMILDLSAIINGQAENLTFLERVE